MLADFLVHKNQMNGAASFRLARIDQHVNASNMTELQAKRFDQLCDRNEIGASNGRVDVSRQTSSEWINGINVQVNRQAADDPVFDTGLR